MGSVCGGDQGIDRYTIDCHECSDYRHRYCHKCECEFAEGLVCSWHRNQQGFRQQSHHCICDGGENIHFYSQETAGKTWPAINKIDSWVRGALPAVGAPLSVRKLRDCYKNTLSTANRKDFDENAVVHMKAGASR